MLAGSILERQQAVSPLVSRVAGLVLFALVVCGYCEESFQIKSVVAVGDSVEVACDSTADHYYVLYSGPQVADTLIPVAIELGTPGSVTLRHTLPPGDRLDVYRVLRVPLSSPLDFDGDGFDDVVEVRSPHANPLAANPDSDSDGMPNSFEQDWGLDASNPADAGLDLSGDGFTNLDAFRLGLDPFTPALANARRIRISTDGPQQRLGVAGAVQADPFGGGSAQLSERAGQGALGAASPTIGAPPPIASGGTGAASPQPALNALLPSQTGQAGNVLQTDGANASWGSGGLAVRDCHAASNRRTSLHVPDRCRGRGVVDRYGCTEFRSPSHCQSPPHRHQPHIKRKEENSYA